MDLKLYEAAESGDIGAFRNCTVPLHQVLTICKNTILHVFLSAQLVNEQHFTITERDAFVDQILDLCPNILMQKNDKEEIPLHLAARYGYSGVVEVLIRHAKKLGSSGSDDVESVMIQTGSADDQEFQMMMRIPNKEKDTALHEAAKNNFLSIVKILKQEDRSSLPYPANDLGHTPLYIAARLGYSEVVAELLKGSQIVAGPNGRTALHAAVDCRSLEMVKVLLEHDKGAAYIGDKDSKTTLHLAAAAGSWSVMETIVSHCPDCCEQVDNKGWNALHYAATNGKVNIIVSSMESKRLKMLLYDKDYNHGNTPSHLLVASGSNIWPNNPAINKKEHGSRDIFREIRKQNVEMARESHLIVAILIATVTFAAAFTMPGGLKSDDCEGELGTPILSRNAAFKTFVVTDALAMVLSLSAVFNHFLLPLCSSKPRIYTLFVNSTNLIVCAIGAMVVAFVSGTYAVLSLSPGLAITTCIIGLAFFPFAFIWLFDGALKWVLYTIRLFYGRM